MSHTTEVVAESFASLIAEGGSARLVDDAGERLAVEVPLAMGGSAVLAFNDAAERWVLTVERESDHFPGETLDDLMEILITETNKVRFGAGMVAGLTGAGALSLSIPLSGAPDARSIRLMLDGMVELLAPQGGERPAASSLFAEVDPTFWIPV